jgi:group I intron endonuclease
MKYLIYKHTNNISNKAYIGYTHLTIENRWKGHLKESRNNISKRKISKAIRKYPKDSWTHEILIDNIPTLKEAKNLEIIMIFKYDTYHHGYNLTLGGDGCGKPSEETKKHLSEVHKGIPNNWLGRKHSEISKKNMSKSHKGFRHAEESKKKCSETLKKKNIKRNLYGENNPFYGRNHSEKSKEKQRLTHLGKKASEETKKKMSEAQKKRWLNLKEK